LDLKSPPLLFAPLIFVLLAELSASVVLRQRVDVADAIVGALGVDDSWRY
jgi:hypothetical protein